MSVKRESTVTSFLKTTDLACVTTNQSELYVQNVNSKYLSIQSIYYLFPLCLISDVDECERSDANGCDSNALCTNTEGSYVCRCLRGFSGDGRSCLGKLLVTEDCLA